MLGFARRTAPSLAPLASIVIGACTTMTNLTDTTGPRFLGSFAPATAPAAGAPMRIVSFNIKHAREIDRAIVVLATDSLRNADILSLQEMDAAGVERIARALRLNYAYFPASVHPTTGRYFGPAVLSRWPIERSWKVLLPHAGWTRGQRRTATAAVVRIQASRVLVYAVHLETPVQISESERRDQVLAVVEDAATHAGPVVVAGDFNGSTVGPIMRRAGYVWETASVGPTISVFSWDHIFTRGIRRTGPVGTGVVSDTRGASDHRPVWAVVPSPGAAKVGFTPPSPKRRAAGG
jgi:endonuclease/exonuclease/phosphatase (EEP) superfamily protein YafD